MEVNAPRHRRSDPALIDRLTSRALGTPESRLLAALERAEPCGAAALERAAGLASLEAQAALDALVREGAVRLLVPPAGEPVLVRDVTLARYEEVARRSLAAYHAAHPLRFAMPREELRGALGLGQREFAAVLGGLAPGLAVRGDGVVEAGWEPRPTSRQRAEIEAASAALAAGGLQPERAPVEHAIAAYLVEAGRAVDCGDGVLLDAAAFAAARGRIEEAMRADAAPLTLGQARDLLGVSRRNAQAILETLDRQGVTMRVDEGRALRAAR